MRPSDSQLRDWAKLLRQTDWDGLVEAAIRYKNRDRESVEPDGYPTSTMGSGRGSSEHTSTEAAVIARESVHRDDFHDDVANLLTALGDCIAARNTAKHRLEHLDEMQQIKPTVGRSEPICAEPNCDDPAARGRDGRCEACAKWRQRWITQHQCSKVDVPAIPRDVIQQRLLQRENRKVHVTGPNAVPTVNMQGA